MNLSCAQKLTEESQVFRAQPRQHYELAGGSQPATNLCNSKLSSQSFYPYSSNYPYVYINNSSNWEIYEAIRTKELEEVKARAAQMEKTMRWWSDCTANWREKWSKVRAERNKALEEARQLRIKLEIVVKELSMLKKINKDLVSEKENFKNIISWEKESSCSEKLYIKEDLNQLISLEQEPVEDMSKTNEIPVTQDTKKDAEVVKEALRSNQNKKITPKPPDSFPKGVSTIYLEEPKKRLDDIAKTSENDFIHVSVLHLHLAELQKILQNEREMNVFLEKEVEKMENDLSLWKWKYEKLRQSKLKSLQQELQNLQHSYSKLKKECQEKVMELVYANKKVEEHETEVKILRIRVEDLERELNQSEDENKEIEESELRIWDQTKFLVCCWRLHQDSE
nr:PREDICTED: coiled-coil domain-containing protein 102B isoform X1 [Struthio camelus australis]XP_009671533.1 PREDICTED: coiled-coil domain-containing protein 102B isoform X1 [Struthio camelus australis]